MLLSSQALKELKIVDSDSNKLGTVKDCYFDDFWGAVRYLNVHLSWGSNFLLSPVLLQNIDLSKKEIVTRCSKAEVKACPSANDCRPISKAYEEQQNRYFGLPHYWLGESTWGDVSSAKEFLEKSRAKAKTAVQQEGGHRYHLRSANEVNKYEVYSTDKKIGSLSDLLIEIGTWEIRYLIVNTSSSPFGTKVMLGFEWDIRFDWEKQSVFLNFNSEKILNAPLYDSSKPVNSELETQLYDYYGKPYRQNK